MFDKLGPEQMFADNSGIFNFIQSLFLQWFVKLMGPSLFLFIILIGFFLG